MNTTVIDTTSEREPARAATTLWPFRKMGAQEDAQRRRAWALVPATMTEIWRYGPYLATSLICYVASAGAHSFIGNLTLEAVRREFHVSVGEVSAFLGGLSLLRPLLLCLSGPTIDLAGPSATICISLAVLGALCIAMSQTATTISHYYFFRGVIYLFSPFSDQPAHICMMSTYFQQYLPFAASTINSGYSMAGATFPLALAPLVGAFGWRSGWLCVGVLCLVLALAGWFILKPGPLAVGSRPAAGGGDSGAAPGEVAEGIRFNEAVRGLPFWALMCSAICVMYWEGTVTNHLISEYFRI